ncbi:ABC transporter ATP-binding protein [Solimonas terrae]|uniref:ATP-binding cassette domain-containing protein n=1 Tax=Solimonas terrae TaxID=1396819 RepID=A0A6M2BVJ1_9GAMM|nr:ATP-binding cassette domain-containing protein [Solimonas terrae]NGY06576.1 ATP-binding cassette domain-containing protein [Solimonas terrae]
MASSSAVRASGVSKQVSSGGQPLTILDHVDLDVAAGESLAIVGSSGSGKTTLLSLLAGLDLPSSGEIALAGTSLNGLDEDARAALRAGRVGFVFQSFQLLAGFTALENVMLPVELAGLGDARARATAALESVGLSARLGHYPQQLSGGEQQRVALARAFCGEPQILFADEPTGNLDTITGGHIIELMFELNRARNTTLVLVTHDATLAARCGRRLTLASGRVQAQ